MKNRLVNQRKRSNCLAIFMLVIGVVTFTFASTAGTSLDQESPDQDIMQYIYKNIQYPHEAVKKREEGLVTVSFRVNKNESTCSSTESKSSFKDNVIQMAINHFSLSYSLYDENTVFEVSYADTVFARNLKKENNQAKWINDQPYEGIVAVSIFRKLDEIHGAKLPSKFKEKNGKLFYWHDTNFPVTRETIETLGKYGLVEEERPSEELDKVITLVFDDAKGVVYFFQRENPLIFRSILTNKPLGTYTPPKL